MISTKEERKKYYDRWADRFRKLDGRDVIIDKIIAKYGHRRSVADVIIFDILYEYASRYGEENKGDKSVDFDDELLIRSYKVDGHEIGLVYVENPFIWIW